MPFDAADFHRRGDPGPPPKRRLTLDVLRQMALSLAAFFSAGFIGGFVRGSIDESPRLPSPEPFEPMPPIASLPAEIAGGIAFFVTMVGFVCWFVRREMTDL